MLFLMPITQVGDVIILKMATKLYGAVQKTSNPLNLLCSFSSHRSREKESRERSRKRKAKSPSVHEESEDNEEEASKSVNILLFFIHHMHILACNNILKMKRRNIHVFNFYF